MTVEEAARRLGEWTKCGDVGNCDAARCLEVATNYVELGADSIRPFITLYYCYEHFQQYLRIRDEIREKERNNGKR